MRTYRWQLTVAILYFLALSASATTCYVNVNSTNAQSPFLDWSTAATNIQDAVDVAVAGDEVVVMDGVYGVGGRVVYGAMTNRVAVDKPITLRSVNGPNATFIQGASPAGNSAVRCVYLSDGAILSGFTLTNGATRNSGDLTRERSGGGLWCQSTNSFASNCVLVQTWQARMAAECMEVHWRIASSGRTIVRLMAVASLMAR